MEKNICIKLKKEIYSKESVLSASVKFSDCIYVTINSNENEWILKIERLNGAVFCEEFFLKEIQIQEIRNHLNVKFSTLRESIYKKAFSLLE